MDSVDLFKHVYWLGGSPCGGKSTVSRLLAEWHGLAVFHVDDTLPDLMQAVSPDAQPALARWRGRTWDERWSQPVDDLLAEAQACYREHCRWLLARLPRQINGPTLVEGCALLPGEVADLAPRPARALWLIPAAEFQYKHYAGRDWVRGILAECRDPQAALANWMQRDARFGRWAASEARRCGYEGWAVDGIEPAEAVARRVAAHFGLEPRQVQH